jgi:hypothetical protein
LQPLLFAVPAEIVPRKHRSAAIALANIVRNLPTWTRVLAHEPAKSIFPIDSSLFLLFFFANRQAAGLGGISGILVGGALTEGGNADNIRIVSEQSVQVGRRSN